MVLKASHIPLYLQIEQELLALVHGGQLEPYQQVPSEVELAERYEVSRMTARKALDRLVGEGILFRQPGKGTFVAPPKIAHRFSTRLSFSAAMDAAGLRHTTRVLEAAVVPAPQQIAGALGLPSAAPTVFIQRLRLVEDEPAAIHASYLPGRFERILELDLTGSLTEAMAKVGAVIAHARDTVEAVLATGEDAALLHVRPGAPLVCQQGIGYSSTQEPLRYTDALYRGDRFRFSVDSAVSGDLKPELKSEETRVP